MVKWELRAHPGMCRDSSQPSFLGDLLCWMISPAAPGVRTQPMGWVQPPRSSLESLLSPQDEQDRLPLPSWLDFVTPRSPPGSVPTSEFTLIPSGISPPLPPAAFSAFLGFLCNLGPEHPRGFSSPSPGLGADPALNSIPAFQIPLPRV